jgi:hypothetical protein
MLDDVFTLSQTLIRVRKRNYRRSFLEDNILDGRYMIVGPRGVGKTTIMIQHLLDRHDGDVFTRRALYIQADHFLVQRFSLYEIVDEFQKIGGETVCIDEIHKYPGWSMELKSIIDTFADIRILASGSSALEIHKGSHDLSRRMMTLRLNGLSFREYLGMVHGLEFDRLEIGDLLAGHQSAAERIVDEVGRHGHRILALFGSYLRHGYYPYCLEYPDPAHFLATLVQQVQTTLEADLPAVHPNLSGASIRKMRRLLAVISGLVPFTPDMKTLKTLLDIGDERTLKTYLGYLEDAGILLTVSKTDKGLRAMEKPGKIYLNNPNLYHALAGRAEPDRGAIRETFFLNMLHKEHRLRLADKGDFVVDETMTFEVGGKSKDGAQLKGVENGWLALDNMEIGQGNRIPLWLFGFLD